MLVFANKSLRRKGDSLIVRGFHAQGADHQQSSAARGLKITRLIMRACSWPSSIFQRGYCGSSVASLALLVLDHPRPCCKEENTIIATATAILLYATPRVLINSTYQKRVSCPITRKRITETFTLKRCRIQPLAPSCLLHYGYSSPTTTSSLIKPSLERRLLL